MHFVDHFAKHLADNFGAIRQGKQYPFWTHYVNRF